MTLIVLLAIGVCALVGLALIVRATRRRSRDGDATCARCGSHNEAFAKFCAHCGAPLA